MKQGVQRMEGLNIRIVKQPLVFRQPAMTSRDILVTKPSIFLCALHEDGRRGFGECSLIPGLSLESEGMAMDALLQIRASGILEPDAVPENCPSVRFAVEMALMDLERGGRQNLLNNAFSRGQESILINGLIWMDSQEHMLRQAEELVQRGFTTLKMKIGMLPFSEELIWLEAVRELSSRSKGVTLRVDANGAFSKRDANWTPEQKLIKLAELGVQSIEQPLMPSDREGLAELCALSPIPIALDESLIGVFGDDRIRLVEEIRPQFLILKPSLLGGLASADAWVRLAETNGVGWWVTSALESNVGLNAIAQWTAGRLEGARDPLPQGLGTGGLFSNNIDSPLTIEGNRLRLRSNHPWSWPTAFEE